MREFRALWAAEALSVAGDQLARVALAVLVYARTSSATLTALTYALTFLPALVGGFLLSGLADRYPRRAVMVAADVVRAALAGLMALPGMPLPVVMVLVGLLAMAGAPFKAAQLALLPQILDGERYVVGLALRSTTSQTAQLIGFAGGGALIALLNPYLALAINAGSFAIAALLVRTGVHHRPAPAAVQPEPGSAPKGQARAALGLIWRDRRLRTLSGLIMLAGFFVVPEGLAAPYASELAAGAAVVGLLMAADPFGSVVGALVFTRWVPEPARMRLIGVLAVAAGVPLLVSGWTPGVLITFVLWAFFGSFAAAYHIQAQASFIRTVPDERRGQAIGLLSSAAAGRGPSRR